MHFQTFFFFVCCTIGQVWSSCLPTIPLILDDVHDGDQKIIKSIEWDTFVIRPYGNDEDWEIEGTFNINCVAIIDFNVSGKPDYPPVPLKMAMWVMQSVAIPSAVKLGFEFTDPSELLAPKTQPLNMWMSAALSYEKDLQYLPRNVTAQKNNLKSSTCLYTPHGEPEIFNDILVSDMKGVTVDDDNMSIEPYNNNQAWVVESTFSEGCVAMVNFDVPGYPNPPNAPQTMSIWGMASIAGADKDGMVYTKPSDGIPIGSPLNVWLPGNE
mmetsp:Transcript_7047/g.11784  ORF Transcript_7047/g.11784 Transcript_7047/m.11784 type:complete len:268 (+) Transcript_7047:3659-4462(+)